MKYDTIQEVGVAKTFDQIVEVEKFNPFHDKLGRFASKNGFSTYSANPKTTSGAKAISRSVDYKHGATINVHHESQGKTLDENAYWLKTGQKMPTADEPKAEAPTKKPKAQTKPKPKAETETQGKPKAFGNQEIENGHEPYDKYGNVSVQPNKAVNAIQEATGCSNLKAIEMMDAVCHFSGSGYEAIRGVQTGEIKASSSNYNKYEAEGNALESFIKESPKWDGSGTLYRGISVNSETAANIIKKAQAGEPLDQRGTASWTSQQSIARSFAGWGHNHADETSIMFVMEGGTMKGTSIKHLSKYSNENEILMSKTQRCKATKVKETDQGWLVECVELP